MLLAGKNGRPTKSEQIEIQNKLRPYYERGLSATFTASSTGINIKTVCKYFEEWSKKIIETEATDFVQRQKKAKELVILNMDNIIFEQYRLLEEIKNEKKNYQKENKQIPTHLLSLQHQILKEISTTAQHKCDIECMPTLDFSLDQMIDKRFAKAAAA